METTRFGRTDLQVSRLGFGAAPVGILETDYTRAETILNELLDHGVNLIDTAACYGGSEKLIGDAVGHRRDEYVLVSKAGHLDGSDLPDYHPDLIKKSIDRSLLRLDTDVIDVVLLHTCDFDELKNGDALGALIDARDAGKIRHAGYSGDNDAVAYAAALDDIDVIETSVSIADQTNLRVAVPAARKFDVGVLAKRPLANAAWRDASDQQGFYADYASEYARRLAAMSLDLDELGFDQSDWPELALRFTLSQPGVHCAIVGTTDPDHVQANLDAAAKGPLPDDVVEKIRRAFDAAEALDTVRPRWQGET